MKATKAKAPASTPPEAGEKGGLGDGTLAGLSRLLSENPGAFKPYATVARSPLNGNVAHAQYIDKMPGDVVAEGEDWLARHPMGGPGRYLVQLCDATTARKVATAEVWIASDLRPASTQVPAHAAPPPHMMHAGALDPATREILAATLAQQQQNPFAIATGMLDMVNKIAATREATSPPATAASLDWQKAMELGAALERKGVSWSEVIAENAPALIGLGTTFLHTLEKLGGRPRVRDAETVDVPPAAPVADEVPQPDTLDAQPETPDDA